MKEGESDAWLHAAKFERHIFLSPHFDDVAFACGGTVARLTRRGARVSIAVVFAAAPPPGTALTRFATDHDALWGLAADAAASNAGRRAEERASAALLGADVVTLPLLDAIYRGDRYAANEQLFGSIHPAEQALPVEIVSTLVAASGSLVGSRCYVPLAVGRHVDHQLTFRAGRLLAAAGIETWCYADLPYSLRETAIRSRMMEVAPELGAPRRVRVDEVWATRLAAVMAYRSQLPSAFGYVGVEPTRGAIATALDRYAGGVSARYERFWQLSMPEVLPFAPTVK